MKLKDVLKSYGDLLRDFKHPKNDIRNALDYKRYGFTAADLEREFFIDSPEMGGFLAMKKTWKLKDLI